MSRSPSLCSDAELAQALAHQFEYEQWREEMRRFRFEIHHTPHRIWGSIEEETMNRERIRDSAKDLAEALDYHVECLQEIEAQDQLTAVYDSLEALKSRVDKLAGETDADADDAQ